MTEKDLAKALRPHMRAVRVQFHSTEDDDTVSFGPDEMVDGVVLGLWGTTERKRTIRRPFQSRGKQLAW